MNLVGIIFRFVFITITILSSVTQRYDPLVAADPFLRNKLFDISDDLDAAEKHRSWKLCLESNRPRIECNAQYESAMREEKPLTRLLHYHALLEEPPHVHHRHCRSKRSEEECILDKHDRKKRVAIMEKELYPWKEIYDMCIVDLEQDDCYDILNQLQIPKYRTLMPESLITIGKVHICLDAGRSVEDCESEASEHFDNFVAPKDEL